MTADFAAGPFDIDWDAAVADTVFGRAGEIGLEHEEFAEVVELVRIARRPGSVDELIGDDAMIARIAAAVDEARAPIEPSPLSRVTKRHSVRFAAAIAVMAMIGGTAAAASTGSLPPHVQNSLATRLAVVGIDLPVHHPRHRAVHPAAAVHKPVTTHARPAARPAPHRAAHPAAPFHRVPSPARSRTVVAPTRRPESTRPRQTGTVYRRRTTTWRPAPLWRAQERRGPSYVLDAGTRRPFSRPVAPIAELRVQSFARAVLPDSRGDRRRRPDTRSRAPRAESKLPATAVRPFLRAWRREGK